MTTKDGKGRTQVKKVRGRVGPQAVVTCCVWLCWSAGEGLYTENGKNWSMQKQAEAYADAVAYAIRFWAGQPLESDARVEEVRSLDRLTSSLVSFDGGHAGSELYWPRRQACDVSFSSSDPFLLGVSRLSL